jgi:peptidoglycan hydrolase-like protein with peptidoglycan-binding domain
MKGSRTRTNKHNQSTVVRSASRIRSKLTGFHAFVVIALVTIAGSVLLLTTHAAACNSATFSQGSSGQCVKNIQMILNGMKDYSASLPWPFTPIGGSYLTVDGSFGPKTKAQVMDFQLALDQVPVLAGMKVDGIVGPQTWRVMCTAAQSNFASASSTSNEKLAYVAAVYSGCRPF